MATHSQRTSLTFHVARSGELRGLAVHVEIRVDPESPGAEISSEADGSHWPRVLLLLPRGVHVAEGEVRAQRNLSVLHVV